MPIMIVKQEIHDKYIYIYIESLDKMVQDFSVFSQLDSLDPFSDKNKY